jgi:hypothetical protein
MQAVDHEREKLITRDELAGLLNVSTQQVINLEKKGIVEGLKIGGSVRYRYSTIMAQLEKDSKTRKT